MDAEDQMWAIIAEIAAVPIEGRIERLVDGEPFVRVLLDDYYCIDCQRNPEGEYLFEIHVRRYDLMGAIVYDKVPYASQDWKHAAKCIELCHRVHEVGIKDNMERLEYTLAKLL
jgi:hypothetical protein